MFLWSWPELQNRSNVSVFLVRQMLRSCLAWAAPSQPCAEWTGGPVAKFAPKGLPSWHTGANVSRWGWRPGEVAPRLFAMATL